MKALKTLSLRLALIATAVFICSSFTVMPCKSKQPVLKGTTWTSIQKMFVADAGTMTITTMLEFTSKKDVTIRQKHVMPSHPAMYMNADGTVDRIPGYENEFSEAGTYTFKKDILTITKEGGNTTTLLYRADGTFQGKGMFGEEEEIFTKNL